MTPAKSAPILIKKTLSQAYQKTKFSTRSERSTINITYTDGPPESDVESLVKKFKLGFFDGMTDCYEITNRRDDIPQVNYIFINRKYSEKKIAEEAAILDSRLSNFRGHDLNYFCPHLKCTKGNYIYQMLKNKHL